MKFENIPEEKQCKTCEKVLLISNFYIIERQNTYISKKGKGINNYTQYNILPNCRECHYK